MAQQQFEFCNNWLMNVSFVTGTDRGMDQNLDDNLGWMNDHGYTHLRFFGIFPNGVHCFPSLTLDANGYPNSSYHEPVLEFLVTKAAQFGITVNFDGWEVIAESNYDTTVLGVGFITEEELGAIVQEVFYSPAQNHLFYEDYQKIIGDSKFRTLFFKGYDHRELRALYTITSEILDALHHQFPRNRHFLYDGIMACLRKD